MSGAMAMCCDSPVADPQHSSWLVVIMWPDKLAERIREAVRDQGASQPRSPLDGPTQVLSILSNLVVCRRAEIWFPPASVLSVLEARSVRAE